MAIVILKNEDGTLAFKTAEWTIQRKVNQRLAPVFPMGQIPYAKCPN